MEPPLTLVLLEHFVTLDMQAVAEAIRSRHPSTLVTLPEPHDATSPIIVCAGEIVVLMPMPAPAPQDDAAVAMASAAWPEARAAFDRHRARLIVSAMSTSQHPLQMAHVATAVVGGLIAAVPGCVGLCRGPLGRAGRQPGGALAGNVRAAFNPYPNFPFMLWIGVHPFRDQSTIGAVTYELSSFVGREIKFEGKACIEQMAEVPFAEHDGMVKAIPSDRTDQPLRISVLPWRPWRNRSIPVPIARSRRMRTSPIGVVPIADDISRRLLPAVEPRKG
jgi:hypothetical protein